MSKLWQDTLGQLEARLNPQHFATWIKPLRLVRIDRDLVVLEVTNRFVLDWVRDNYAKLIQQVLAELSAVSYRLQIDVAGQDKDLGKTQQRLRSVNKDAPLRQSEVIPQNEGQADINLNRKYTFEEFVAGSSNQFAFAAAMAVANNPATTYNPLFIYGGVGLGKTHLVNAIGNAILKKSPSTRVCYYTSEKFTNELIKVFGLWSAIEIYLPPDWTVTAKVSTLLGGFIDKRRPTSVVPTRTLVVRGMNLMSGIEVKN